MASSLLKISYSLLLRRSLRNGGHKLQWLQGPDRFDDLDG